MDGNHKLSRGPGLTPNPLTTLPRERRPQTAVSCLGCAAQFDAARKDRRPDQPAIYCPFCAAPISPTAIDLRADFVKAEAA